MKINTLKPILVKALQDPNNRMNILLVGSPGIGKTELLKAISKELDRSIMLKHPVVESPIDGKGLPVSGTINNELTADFIPYGDLKRMMNTTEPLIVLIDDLGQAVQSVQAVYMQLIQERAINGKRISDMVQFVAATNDKTHNAGVSGLITPLLSRFATIITLEADADSWIDWAIGAGIDETLLAYIKMNPADVNTFDPKNKGLVNFSCPRTLENLNKWIKLGINNLEVWEGCVGSKVAINFKAFYDIKDTILKYLKDIENTPSSAPLINKADQLYFMVNVLANKCKLGEDYFDNIVVYIRRLQTEYQASFMKAVTIKYPNLQKTKTFCDWHIANQDFVV